MIKENIAAYLFECVGKDILESKPTYLHFLQEEITCQPLKHFVLVMKNNDILTMYPVG